MAGKQEAYSEAENRVFRAAIRKLVEERGLTQDQLGAILGIAQQNAGRFIPKTSTTGLGRTTANNLARYLGYESAEHFLIEHERLALMNETPPQHPWSERESAIRLAGFLKIDAAAVEAVVKRFTTEDALAKKSKWWVDKFYHEELEQLADAARERPREVKQPPMNRARRKRG